LAESSGFSPISGARGRATLCGTAGREPDRRYTEEAGDGPQRRVTR
jgi:hypothetical protein